MQDRQCKARESVGGDIERWAEVKEEVSVGSNIKSREKGGNKERTIGGWKGRQKGRSNREIVERREEGEG